MRSLKGIVIATLALSRSDSRSNANAFVLGPSFSNRLAPQTRTGSFQDVTDACIQDVTDACIQDVTDAWLRQILVKPGMTLNEIHASLEKNHQTYAENPENVENWILIDRKDIDNTELSGVLQALDDTGIKILLYKNCITDEVTANIRGSLSPVGLFSKDEEIKKYTKSNWGENYNNIFKPETEGAELSEVKTLVIKFARTIKEIHPNVRFEGHSLGGFLSIISALITDSSATVFNSAMPDKNFLKHLFTNAGMNLSPEEVEERIAKADIINFANRRDLIHSWANKTPQIVRELLEQIRMQLNLTEKDTIEDRFKMLGKMNFGPVVGTTVFNGQEGAFPKAHLLDTFRESLTRIAPFEMHQCKNSPSPTDAMMSLIQKYFSDFMAQRSKIK